MTMVFTSDQAATGVGLPTYETLEQYETLIAAIPGLRAWWDASNPAYRTDVAGKCSQVNDRGPNGFHLLQATAANRFTVSTDYWGQLNGVHRDALLSDGATDIWMATAGNVFDGSTQWWEFLVFKVLNNAALGAVFSAWQGTTDANYSLIVPSAANGSAMVFPGGGAGATVTVPGGLLQKLVVIASLNYTGSGNAAFALNVNGTTGAASAVIGANGPGTSVGFIGSFGHGHALKANAALAERIVVKGTPPDAPTSAMLTAYAALKYR